MPGERLKWGKPVTMMVTIASAVPTQSVSVTLRRNVIFRHKRNKAARPAANRHVLLASTTQSRPEIGGIVSESDHPGCDFQRPAQNELPDEKKSHQAAPSLMAVGLAKKMVAAAGAWQRRPQFAPYQTVGNYDERPRQPAQHGLRAAHGSHQQRNRDERPDPNHVGHVQGRGRK